MQEPLVFISYRREDSAGYAGRLFDDLTERVAPARLFIDVDAIPAGADFHRTIGSAIEDCAALLALIGPRWLDIQDASGRRRIDDANDLVRIEIEAALARDILIVPILLQGAVMPSEMDLPEGLKPLAKRNALAVRDSRWHADVDVLAAGLARLGGDGRATAGRGQSEAFWTSGPADVELPYLGLRPFEEEDSRFFFGREAEVEALLDRLRRDRFLAVFGPSGGGKSSLVRAGLVGALRHDTIPGSKDWPIEVLRPGARPIDALAMQLARYRPDASIGALVDRLTNDERALHLETLPALAEAPDGAKFVWVIDQAEELFTLCRDEAQRDAFVAAIVHAAAVIGGRTVVVMAMRADFYQRCAIYPALAASVSRSQFLVSPMGDAALRRAIEEPARAVGLVFEPGLVDTIVADVAARPGTLPLLEHALYELFQRRRGVTLTLEGYRTSGAVDGALAKRAESVYDNLDLADKALVRRVLLRLTQPGEGTEDTRRRASMRDLPMEPGEVTAVEHVVDALTEARLLTLDAGDQTGEPFVEIAHEALIRAWPRVRGWIEDDREALRVHFRIAAAAAEWERLRRVDDALLRGVRLSEAVEWRASHADLLNDAERTFLDASAGAYERELRSRDRRRRRTLATTAGLAGFFVCLALVAFVAWQGAEAARQDASVALEQARRSESQAKQAEAQASDTIVQLTAKQDELERARQVAVGRGVISEAGRSDTPFDVSILLGLEGRRLAGSDANTLVIDRLTLHPSLAALIERPTNDPDVATVASPDLRRVAFERGGSIILVDRGPAKVERELGSMRVVFRLAFSPDGSKLLAAGEASDGTLGAVLWDVTTGSSVVLPAGDWVTIHGFSADGRHIATDARGQAEDRVRLVVWDTTNGRAIRIVDIEAGNVWSVALDRDGSHMAAQSSSVDHRQMRTEIFEVASGARRVIAVERTGGGTVSDRAPIVFSPIRSILVVSRYDAPSKTSKVDLWDVASVPRRLQTLENEDFITLGAAFRPDGVSLALAGQDLDGTGGVQWWRTGRAWAVDDGTGATLLSTPAGPQRGAAFSPDGNSLLASSDTGVTSVWTMGTDQLAPTLTPMPDGVPLSDLAAVGPGGDHPVVFARALRGLLALPSRNAPRPQPVTGTLALVDATAGTDRLIRGADGHVAAFSHDGRWIAVSVGETAVDVVAVDTLTSVRSITSAGVSAVALSPDGRVVVIASSTGTASNTIEAWEVDTGERIGRAAADGVVSFLSYSGDGQHLAVATRETEASARVAIWDAARLTPRMALGALDGTIRSAAFSPDGTHLIALDDRRGLFDWDVATGRLLVVSETPVVEEVGSTGKGRTNLGTSAIGLSPDGSEVVSIGYAVRTWATSALLTTAVETRACQLAGRNLTAAEWERYLPTEPRSMTCPDLPPG